LFFCSDDGGEDGDSNAGDVEAVNNFLCCFSAVVMAGRTEIPMPEKAVNNFLSCVSAVVMAERTEIPTPETRKQ
jgi:hypothetical protein